MLLKVELRRFFTRRFGMVMSLATVAAMAVILIIAMANSHKPSADEIAYAESEAAAARIDMAPRFDECQRMSPLPAVVDGEENWLSGQDCAQYDPDLIDAANYLYGSVSFTQDVPPLMYVFGCLIAMAGMVTAASFVGAEWPTGGMTNLLLWKPRRMEVFFSKLGASLITITAGAFGLTGVFLLLMWVITSVGGYVGDVNSTWLGEFVEQVLRMAALPVMLTVVGFSIAMLGRRTAAALGALAAYAVVFEFGLRIIGQFIPGLYFLELFTLSPYVIGWLIGRYEIVDYGSSYSNYGDYVEPTTITIDRVGGSIVLLLFTLVLVGAAAWVFKRRDVANG
ncbi:hypothetical protein Afil01_06120 [Actinorhabdospora filicis]|uniref:ABC-2 type transport system permease protein n=1 Tax=Actinorhabdospora filicis TaxID=1785913 RepID=A0A9W6SEM8_9ACTN|nr:ABC transporter permease subunit [Actinorhabdospora filicis]GLZ75805.1 hypothetical protein Afil01_06120 [Actinorhabdospora filicis]